MGGQGRGGAEGASLVTEAWEQTVFSGGEAEPWAGDREPGLPGGGPRSAQSSSLVGTQCQGDDEAQNQQEHGDREQHRDDHHTSCPGHSQRQGLCRPSCSRQQGGVCGPEEPLSFPRLPAQPSSSRPFTVY